MPEIELKLAIEPSRRREFLRSPMLAGVPSTRMRLANIYFDTPECALRHGQMALRLRRGGRRWVQTLKAGHSGAGGLHAREEWEFDRPGPHLDLALFAETPLARIDEPATLHERLRPVFEVNFTRTAWRLEPAPGCRLEVALDAGSVTSGAGREEISEVEIECLEGDPAHAFALAARLIDDHGLRPSAISKAERGYRLFDGAPLAPAKARAPHLDAAMTPLAAARAAVRAGLEQLQANEEGLIARDDPEFVHQARVALRRVRSALRTFRDAIGRDRADPLRRNLGEVASALGVARDWDVFATQGLPSATKAYGDPAIARSLRARAWRHRARHREGARAALRSTRYAHAILDLALWLAQPEDGAPREDAVPLAGLASSFVRKGHKRLAAGARRLAELSVEERHKLRIDTKRQRYCVDTVAALFKPRPVRAYLAAVEVLQDALGSQNDATTAMRLLAELSPPEPFAAFARGWFSARAAGDPASFGAFVALLSGAPRFWKKAAKPRKQT
ncbi:MAG TPA: CHAD domain-containing protein [Usitatibacter sp.]